MSDASPTIAILGASGLIGASLAESLRHEGFRVVAMARRFKSAQSYAFGEDAVLSELGTLSADELGNLLRERDIDIVVNCLGVLQNGPRGRAVDIHKDFVARLIDAIRVQPKPILLVHLSIPGRDEDDRTDFSRTKRAGERLIAAAGLPSVVLRPGFVIAPVAYGGSALMRALAAVPFAVPRDLGARRFASTAIDDIARTVSFVARRWAGGERRWSAVWTLCEREPATVAAVLEAFRTRFGGPRPLLRLPSWLLWAGAAAGDVAAWLGWSPPVRTTALREMFRGVEGRPDDWCAATGLEPATLSESLGQVSASVQERWFARLYLLKSLIFATLAVFWIVSGSIALTVAFRPASDILVAHGFATGLASLLTVASSLIDIAVGCAIAVRRWSRAGLFAGIAVSLFYMAGAALLTPDLWAEPLGALVKTGPAIVLMMVALAILDDR